MIKKHELLSILSELVAFESITPEDAGTQTFMISFFESLGFECINLPASPVSNFFASIGTKGPMLVFAGHTDVVPVGNEAAWKTPAFSLTEKEGRLYGRGVADMKGSLAAMMVMAKEFVSLYPHDNARLGFLITSGEEGDDFDLGTPYVMQELAKKNIHIDYCIVGEPSSKNQLGDIIKVGRRGSLTGKLKVYGKQGHVAYPQLAINPIHQTASLLNKLVNLHFDKGNTYFPPTSFQITAIDSGGQANNIIPGELTLQFNLRFSPESTVADLKSLIQNCCQDANLQDFDLQWQLNGKPFLTEKGKLRDSLVSSIKEITGLTPEFSTDGGTSDARFIAPYGVEVIELGPCNASIHQVNENVSLDELQQLSEIYLAVAKRLLLGSIEDKA